MVIFATHAGKRGLLVLIGTRVILFLIQVVVLFLGTILVTSDLSAITVTSILAVTVFFTTESLFEGKVQNMLSNLLQTKTKL